MSGVTAEKETTTPVNTGKTTGLSVHHVCMNDRQEYLLTTYDHVVLLVKLL